MLLIGLLAACDTGGGAGSATVESVETAPVRIRTNLGRHRDAVPVDHRLVVRVANGELQRVRVAFPGGRLEGRLREGRWRADDRLEPGTGYVVKAVARGAGGAAERVTRRFRTEELSLDEQTYPSVAPLAGETVGVGMPVVVRFDLPVEDRATFERHMRVTSVPRQAGSWHWIDDTEVRWRPRTYWRAGSEVTVDLDLNSLPAGDGIYGQTSRTVRFTVGDSVVHKVDVDAHLMRSYVNGELAHTSPISAGKSGFETRSGTKVVIAKHRYYTMDASTIGIGEGDPEYYNIEDVEYALRVTFSGEFLHAAPWSIGAQGSANVSHGCVGMSLADARWVYENSRRGDVVEVTGTDRQMSLTNGYGDWNASFADYREGSALS